MPLIMPILTVPVGRKHSTVDTHTHGYISVCVCVCVCARKFPYICVLYIYTLYTINDQIVSGNKLYGLLQLNFFLYNLVCLVDLQSIIWFMNELIVETILSEVVAREKFPIPILLSKKCNLLQTHIWLISKLTTFNYKK